MLLNQCVTLRSYCLRPEASAIAQCSQFSFFAYCSACSRKTFSVLTDRWRGQILMRHGYSVPNFPKSANLPLQIPLPTMTPTEPSSPRRPQCSASPRALLCPPLTSPITVVPRIEPLELQNSTAVPRFTLPTPLLRATFEAARQAIAHKLNYRRDPFSVLPAILSNTTKTT